MKGYIDLFSGIGGFALAAYWSGLRFDKHYFSEVDEYAIKLYQKRFPDAIPLGDIRNVDYGKLPKGEYLVTGGFPCQPHSTCGKRQGDKDERDLWGECKRALCELRPRIALFENVRAILRTQRGMFFNRVLSDISESGYDAEWQIISALDVCAAHERKRLWIVAYANSLNVQDRLSIFNKNKETICQKRNELYPNYNRWLQAICENASCRNGISEELDAIRGAGNAIVPQCAEVIFNLPAFDYWREE